VTAGAATGARLVRRSSGRWCATSAPDWAPSPRGSHHSRTTPGQWSEPSVRRRGGTCAAN
ncbi:unnamed protein product, partial [Scytosiphon promiscuus]